MRGLRIAIAIILLLFLSTAAYSQEKPGSTNEQPGASSGEGGGRPG